MDINTEQYERIIHFLDANMTLEEMDAFEKELADNPAMRQQLDFELQARDSFAFNKNKIIDSTTNAIPVININSKRKKWFAIAAAAAVIVAIFSIIFLMPKKVIEKDIVQGNDTNSIKKNDTAAITITQPNDSIKTLTFIKLYQQYFTADAVPETYPMYLAEAFTSYQSGDYTAIQKLNLAAIPEMRGNESKQPILELGHYYKGIAFLKSSNIKEAIINLQWVQKNSTDDDLKFKAQWYLALAYLNNNNINEATNLLKKIAYKSTYHRYKDKAKNLLKALEE
jgi:hypothetical protein